MRRVVSTIVVFGLVIAGTFAQAADQLYVSTDSGTMFLLRNLTPGSYSLVAPGAMSVTTLNVEQDTLGVVPNGFSLTTVRTTATPLSGGGQVVLGTTNGYVLTYDANLSSLRTANNLCNGCDVPVQEVEVGQWGDLPVAVAAAHSLDAPLGTGGFSVVSFNGSMEFIGNTGYFDDGTGPDPDVTALRFGNLDASRAGNELLIATTNRNTYHKNSGLYTGVAKDPAATAAAPATPIFVWDNDGDVTNGIANPWRGMNNTIADAYVADSIPDIEVPTGTDELTFVGQSNDFTGPPNEGPHQFGTMVHTFYSISPNPPFFAYENAGARADQVSKPMLAAVAGNVLDSDPNPTGFNFTGPNELIWAGIDELRICNGNTHCTQIIETGEHIQQIALADVLHNDGVLEIVMATGNAPFFTAPATDVTGIPFTGGRIIIYEHDVVGDLNTNFVFDPTGETPRGAIIELGASISVNGLAALLATATPEGIAGDYNDNGIVDAADYTVWRNRVGQDVDLPNDPIGGTIGQAHYNQWKGNFGMSSGGNAATFAGAVPEPATIGIALVSLLFVSSRAARCKPRMT